MIEINPTNNVHPITVEKTEYLSRQNSNLETLFVSHHKVHNVIAKKETTNVLTKGFVTI